MTRGTRPGRLAFLAVLLSALHPGMASEAATSTNWCDTPEEERPEVLPEPVQLCGVTTIRASDPAFVTVHVPQTVRLENPFFSGNDVQVTGVGDFIGFALVRYPLETNNPIFIGGRLPESAGFRTFLDHVGFFQHLRPVDATHTLEPGDYRLFLLPEDSNVATLTLHLDGLSGEIDLDATHRTRLELDVDEPEIAPPDAPGNVYTARSFGSLRDHGLVFSALWFNTQAHVVSEVDFCFYKATAPLDPIDPSTYGPGCAWWGFSPVQNVNGISYGAGVTYPDPSTDPGFKLFYAGDHTAGAFGVDDDPSGPYTAQMAVETAAVVGKVHSLALFLSFE